jgi:hypothetical protein
LPPTPSCGELIVESKEHYEPKERIGLHEDVGKDLITKTSRRFLPFPLVYLKFQLLFSQAKKMLMVLNIIGNVAERNLEFMESFSHLHLMRAPSLMMFAVDPQLQSFHHGHQAFSIVKIKMYTNGKNCMVLSDPLGHSVIPIPYQNHGESVTECSLLESVLKSPHFSFEPTDLASPHHLETNNLSQSVLPAISPVFGMQIADDSLVSWDDKTASGDKNSDI